MANPHWLSFAKPADPATEESYLISAIRERYQVEPLTSQGFFVFEDRGDWISFTVLKDVGGWIKDGATLTEACCIFHGDGPSGNLRECRHTFWGEENNGGYIFYPNGALICAAFKRLSEFFDDMI